MAYQNVKTPRFYIDYLQWHQAVGLLGSTHFIRNSDIHTPTDPHNAVSNVIGLNPTSQTFLNWGGSGDAGFNFQIDLKESFPVDKINVVGIFGHNLSGHELTGDNSGFSFQYLDSNGNFPYIKLTDEFIINGDRNENSINNISLDGFTLCSANGSTSVTFPVSDDVGAGLQPNIRGVTDPEYQFKFGSLLMGRYYKMPHSPDLSLTLTHDYSGIKTMETIGGASLSNARWSKPSKWGDREAWQLGDFPYYYSGRRIWDLSFSYISDTDIEPYSYYGNKYDSDTGDSPTESEGSDNWFQNVLFYTNGGQLAFIFNPDSSIEYLAPDDGSPPRVPEFAICKLDMNSFSRKQVANNVYNIKVKVREVW